jgi:hypothetical protein
LYPFNFFCSVCSLYEQHRIEGIVPEDVEQNYQVHQQRKEESRSDIEKALTILVVTIVE